MVAELLEALRWIEDQARRPPIKHHERGRTLKAISDKARNAITIARLHDRQERSCRPPVRDPALAPKRVPVNGDLTPESVCGPFDPKKAMRWPT